MADTFTSKINGNFIYAKRAERTRSGVNLETFTVGEGASAVTTQGILPAGITTPSSASDDVNILATKKYVQDQMGSVAEALIFKGTIGAAADNPTDTELPATHKVGWTYKVATAGTYAGKACELGDMIICVKNGTVAADADWTVVQNNIDGAVTGPVSATDNAVALFSSTTGKVIKDSGVTINKSTDTGALDGTSDAKVPTSKAVKDAITSAVNALDADVTSASGTKVQVEVVEADGVITGVTVTETGLDTALGAKADKVTGATSGNFAGLDANGNLTDSGNKAADFAAADHVHGNITNDGKIGITADLAVVTGSAGAVTTADLTTADPTVPSSGTTTATAFIDSVSQDSKGKLTATKKNLPDASTSAKGIVQLAGSIGATVASENNKAASEKAVRDAINALDVSEIGGSGKLITTISEADGKISATAIDAVAAAPTPDSGTPSAAGLMYYETVDL